MRKIDKESVVFHVSLIQLVNNSQITNLPANLPLKNNDYISNDIQSLYLLFRDPGGNRTHS